MKEKINNYIKSLGFDWTDISIIPFFTFTIIFILEDVRLMVVNKDLNLSQPLWAYILYASISLVSLISFLVFEYKKGRRPSIISLSCLLILLMFSTVAIFINPNTMAIDILDPNNNILNVVIYLNGEVKFIHLISFFFFIISLFVWVTIIPQKFRNYTFITLICYLVYVLTLVVIIYSLVNDDYNQFFYLLFNNSDESTFIKNYLPVSFFGNANSYALFLELGVFISLLHHSIRKWKIDYFFAFVYYILMFSTLCKAAIFSTTGMFLVFFIVNLLKSIKTKDIYETTISAIFLSFLVSIIIVCTGLYIFSSSIRDKINILLSQIGGFGGRGIIWNIGLQIINNKIFFGNGHGIFNHLLFYSTGPIIGFWYMNAHNSFLVILGEGGIVYLLEYIGLVAYSVFILWKIIKKDTDIAMPLIFGLVVFLFHSFFEDIYYYVELIIVFIIICYNVVYSKSIDKK